MKNKLYVFSGLGADQRVFKYLNFGALEPQFIDWIRPETNEPIEAYARKLATEINVEKPILIGLSFGGMMAVEIAKLRETENVILISSAKTAAEVPLPLRWIGKLGLNQYTPKHFLKRPNPIMDWFFGVETAEDRELLREVMHDSDEEFVYWAINQILCWKNKVVPPNYFHIHGARDRMLPLRHVKADRVIADGGHLMVLNRAKLLNEVLDSILNRTT